MEVGVARPKLGDSASQRLQMVITEDEIKAIDDWQFANRAPSRSEAIRRLVQIGLRFDREAERLNALAEAMSAKTRDYAICMNTLVDAPEIAGTTNEKLLSDTMAALRAMAEMVKAKSELSHGVHSIVAQIMPFKGVDIDLGNAGAYSNQAKVILDQKLHELSEKGLRGGDK